MQAKEAERQQSHEVWLEDQKRRLYQHKVEDLGNTGIESITAKAASRASRAISKEENTRTARLLDSISLG
jgi:hypothetical protein